MFFDSWGGIARVVLVGVPAYAAMVLALRLSGKRTLAKMNAFDLVVTVALGSVLATILLTNDVALVEGVVALGLLIAAQFAVAWTAVRSGGARRAVRSGPTALYLDGRMLRDRLREQRVTEAEVLQSVRAHGIGGLDLVAAVVLESDGSLSVIPSAKTGDRGAVADVHGESAASA